MALGLDSMTGVKWLMADGKRCDERPTNDDGVPDRDMISTFSNRRTPIGVHQRLSADFIAPLEPLCFVGRRARGEKNKTKTRGFWG